MNELSISVIAFAALIYSVFLATKLGAEKQEKKALKKEIERIAQEQEYAKKVKQAVAGKSDADVVKRVRSIKRKKTSK